MTEEDFVFIAEAIRDGRCILFTGPALAVTGAGENAKSINQEIASKLRAMMNRPGDVEEDASLAHIAQAYLMEDQFSRAHHKLVALIQAEFERYAGQTTDFHRKLARLPFRLCLSTSLDGFLQTAFEEVGKAPVSGYLDYSAGKLQMPKLPSDPSTPFVYRLYGSIERHQSLMITEDDLIKYLINVVKRGFPMNLVSILKNPETVFLFLGFGLYHWHLRLLLRILDAASNRKNPSYAFESGVVYSQGARSTVNAYALGQARVFYKYGHKILLGDVSLEDFVDNLAGQFTSGGDSVDSAAQPAQGWNNSSLSGPRVFISYASEDRVRVSAVEKCLTEQGYRVWFDERRLEGGDRYEQEIFREISRTDYFIFAESLNTEPPDENRSVPVNRWWRREVDAAVKRSVEFPVGFKFLIPIRIENCRMPHELTDFHTIDFFAGDGSSKLISSIERDWQLRRRDGLDRSPAI